MMPSIVVPVWLVLLLSACGGASEPSGTKEPYPRVGSQAPDFELPKVGGGTLSLGTFRGERAALLYFSMGPG